ncbi:ATP-grasp domain-containing protein [Lutibacter sp.]
MFLLDKPFISDFLIETIKNNNFKIVATTEAKEIITNDALNWISEKEAVSLLKENPDIPVYTNSENTIDWIERHFSFSNLPDKIAVFKNKLAFRELVKDIFPNFFFKGIAYKDLSRLDAEKLAFPVIVKPAVGFFSIGVYKVENTLEWAEMLVSLEKEISQSSSLYPEKVINLSNFIIEACIEGEEYAIDCYFNSEGTPIVLNILHHVFSSGKDVSDRVYTTSKAIMKQNLAEVEHFLKQVGDKVQLKNFPIHVEIRKTPEGQIVPIEINPLRFGGWCTTADLTWHAYGINSYEYFIKGLKPNWKEIFETRENKMYSIVALDNNSGINETEIDSFNYNLLLSDFENPLDLRKVDFTEYPVFGILFAETSIENKQELNQILVSNLKKYIQLKNK